MCEQQYFAEYNLGIRSPSGLKADKGTIVHKVLEILAFIKQAHQNKNSTIDDDIVGKINVNKYSLDNIIQTVYNYYSSNFKHHNWKDKDRDKIPRWSRKSLDDSRPW